MDANLRKKLTIKRKRTSFQSGNYIKNAGPLGNRHFSGKYLFNIFADSGQEFFHRCSIFAIYNIEQDSQLLLYPFNLVGGSRVK
jgi:hypothetical protein